MSIHIGKQRSSGLKCYLVAYQQQGVIVNFGRFLALSEGAARVEAGLSFNATADLLAVDESLLDDGWTFFE